MKERHLSYDEMKMLSEMTAFHSKCDRVDEAVALIRAFYKSTWSPSVKLGDAQQFENLMSELEFMLDEIEGHYIESNWINFE